MRKPYEKQQILELAGKALTRLVYKKIVKSIQITIKYENEDNTLKIKLRKEK